MATRYIARVDVSLVHDTGRSKGKRVLVKAGDDVPSSVGTAQARVLTGAGLLVPAGPAPVVSKAKAQPKTEEAGTPSSPAEPPAEPKGKDSSKS